MATQKSHSVSAHISWFAELDIKPGQLAAFEALTREMVDTTHNEAGALIYERHINDAGNRIHVFERYVDCESAINHLKDFRKRYGDRFAKTVERRRFVVLGAASDALKQALVGFNAEYLASFDGFSRY